MVRHRFSAEDLRRMVQAGILKEDDRVELLEGKVVEMSPPAGATWPRSNAWS
ncbi:MAG: hypothetical protein ACUVQC_01040 [Thermaceae bacterium]